MYLQHWNPCDRNRLHTLLTPDATSKAFKPGNLRGVSQVCTESNFWLEMSIDGLSLSLILFFFFLLFVIRRKKYLPGIDKKAR